MDQNKGSLPFLYAAACLGLFTGLVEGAGLFILQELDWLAWVMSRVSVTLSILWVAPALDLLLFVLVALVWILLRRIAPKAFSPALGVSFLAFLTFLDWLLLSGRIRHSGALVLAIGLAVVFYRWLRQKENTFLLFCQRGSVWLLAVTVLAAILIEGVPWVEERRSISNLPAARSGVPNVLVLVIDTLRADHLSCYGYPRKVSPNLDRLAGEGMVFENAFATASWTLPSHASMLTGRYPYAHGAVLNSYDGRYPTLGDVLQQNGYRTAAFSANLFFFTPQRGFGRGFIHFDALSYSAEDMVYRTLYGRKFYQYVLPRLGFDDHPARRRAENVNRALLSWIDRDPQPFFAIVNYFDLHDPYLPPQPYRGMFSTKRNPGGRINSMRDRGYPDLTPEQLQEEIDAYDGAIAYVDAQIGELLEVLRRRGLLENTILVITSDHGESFGEHGLLHHRNALYLEAIRVPLILRGPGLPGTSRRVTEPVSIAAIPSTIMGILNLPSGASFPVRSLLGSSATNGEGENSLPVAELAHMPFLGLEKTPVYHGAMRALVDGRWHYIWHSKFGDELYEWKTDPRELHNLAGTEEGRIVVAQFRKTLEGMVSSENAR